MKHPRIALIHATPLAIDPIVAAFGRLWPAARTTNLLDDSLSADLAAEGRLTDAMIGRFLTLARYVHSCGADAILFTCSAFGPAIEATAAAMTIPVLKPNEAMLDQALAAGNRIGLIATFTPSIPALKAELETMARAKEQSITITTRTLPDALAALQRGDASAHDRLIADAATELMPCDALVLGQFSMASAARLIPTQTGCRVLTSPDSAVLRLKETLRADRGSYARSSCTIMEENVMKSRLSRYVAALPAIVLSLSALTVIAPAYAQNYPVRPVRFVVPFVPGGPTDIQGRMLGEKLAQRLGQQVLIDNRGGAGGNIGMDLTAKAPADGYTIVIATVGTWAVNPHLYKLPFDVVKDFAPIIQISTSPGVLAVHPSVPAKSVKELVALAKARPNELNYGSSGVGGFGHISGELFTLMTNTKMIHVPYKSSAPSLTDLIAGQIQVLFNNAISTVPFVQANRIRALATTGAKRLAVLSELPTIAESGIAGYENSSWSAVAAPANTPAPVIGRLHKEFTGILADPEIQKRHADVGAQIIGGSPEQFHAYLKAEVEKFGKLVKSAGIKAASGG